MPSKKSRPSRDEVHAAILQSAQQIAAKDGWQAVTVRKVADSIGYTAPIIYEHFGGKDELLIAILKDGHALLHEILTKAVANRTDSAERIRAMASAYWDFAHERPELYRLMHGMGDVHCDALLLQDFAQSSVELISNELITYNPERINQTNAGEFMVEAWGMLHGLIALTISGYVGKYADSQKVFHMLLNDLIYVLGRKD